MFSVIIILLGRTKYVLTCEFKILKRLLKKYFSSGLCGLPSLTGIHFGWLNYADIIMISGPILLQYCWQPCITFIPCYIGLTDLSSADILLRFQFHSSSLFWLTAGSLQILLITSYQILINFLLENCASTRLHNLCNLSSSVGTRPVFGWTHLCQQFIYAVKLNRRHALTCTLVTLMLYIYIVISVTHCKCETSKQRLQM